MNKRRAAKTKKWAQKKMGRMIGEPIIAVDGFIPIGGEVRASAGMVAASFVSPIAGVAAGSRQGAKQQEAAIAASRRSTSKSLAARFPRTSVYLVATPTRLVVTDSSHTLGQPSRVITAYSLGEVESVTAERGSLMQRTSRLQFIDGTHIKLNSPRGGGYYPQDSLPAFTAAIAEFRSA